MLDPKLQTALNEQIQHEMASAYLYLAMAAHFEAANLAGSAKWMRQQAKEEVGHAMKFFDYVNDRDGRVTLGALPAPRGEYATSVEVWEHALAHERKVTDLISKLVGMAQAAGDYATLGDVAVVRHRAGRGGEDGALDPGAGAADRDDELGDLFP